MQINSIIDIIDGKLLNSPSISFIYSFKTDVNKIKEGDLFIASNLDDIQMAVQKGAFAIITQNFYPIIDNEIAWIKVNNIQEAIIKLLRYKLATYNLKAFYCNPISFNFFKAFSSYDKSLKFISKDFDELISSIDDINEKTILLSKDIELLDKLYPNHSAFEKENFNISNLIEHSIFEVSFTYKTRYFQKLKIPSLYLEEFIRVYDFLNISDFDDSKLKNFDFFKPIFLDKNLNLIEFGKSDKFIIVQNENSLIKKEIDFLEKNFSYGKIIHLNSKDIRNIDKLKEQIKKQSFNALYISGFRLEQVQQALLKEEKELTLF